MSIFFIHGKKHLFMLLFVYFHHDKSERTGEDSVRIDNNEKYSKLTESRLN